MTKLFQQLQQMGQMQSQPQLQPQPQSQSLKNNLSQLMNMMNGQNPLNFLQSLALQNPNVRDIIENYQNSGLTPKQYFYQYAQQQGVNANQFLNS